MPSPLDIVLRAPESKDQKIAQPLFRSLEIMRGVKRSKYWIFSYLPVKRANELLKASFSNRVINFTVIHEQILTRMKRWMT
jgi:hypothetical protein